LYDGTIVNKHIAEDGTTLYDIAYNDGDAADSVSGSSIVTIDANLFNIASTPRTANEPASCRKRTLAAVEDDASAKTPLRKRGRLLPDQLNARDTFRLSSPIARGEVDALADWDAGATEDTPPQLRYGVRTSITRVPNQVARTTAQHDPTSDANPASSKRQVRSSNLASTNDTADLTPAGDVESAAPSQHPSGTSILPAFPMKATSAKRNETLREVKQPSQSTPHARTALGVPRLPSTGTYGQSSIRNEFTLKQATTKMMDREPIPPRVSRVEKPTKAVETVKIRPSVKRPRHTARKGKAMSKPNPNPQW